MSPVDNPYEDESDYDIHHEADGECLDDIAEKLLASLVRSSRPGTVAHRVTRVPTPRFTSAASVAGNSNPLHSRRPARRTPCKRPQRPPDHGSPRLFGEPGGL